MTITYDRALMEVAELAPTLDKPGEFISWAEDICQIVAAIYDLDYDMVTEDVYEKVKEAQNYEDSED